MERTYKEIQDELYALKVAYDTLKLQCDQGKAVLKQAEEKARLSEDKFMKAFFTSPDSVNINRLSDGMYVSVNKGFVDMLGYSEEEVVGKTSLELNIWADPDKRKNLVNLLNSSGRVESFEALFIHKDGHKVIGLMSSAVIDLEGIPHNLNITKDITSRKKIEEALSREQFLINSLMDNIPDHVYFKDLESRFIRINKSHCESFGLKDSRDAIGKSDFDFFSSVHARAAFDDEQTIIRTGKVIQKSEKLTWENKPTKWSSSIKLPLRNLNGDIIGTFGLSRDITDQKKAEEQLLLLANALRGTNECVSITDMNDKVLFLNQAFRNTYGFNQEDLKNESINIIRSPNNPPEVINEILPATLKGGWHGEIFNRRKDGSEFLISLSTAVIKDDNGDPIALIGIASDITVRKRIETENKVLYDINQGITSTSNLDELLSLIHNSLGKVVYADNFFVALINEKTGLFSFPYFVDELDTTPLPTSMAKSCSSYVYRTVSPFLYTPQEFERLEQLNEVELVGSASPSWIGIPLQTPSKVLGVMVLQHYDKENVYSEDDIKFLISIAGQIAFAIERKQAESDLRESERNLSESQKIAGLGSYNLELETGNWTSSKILDSIFGIDEKYERSVKGWTELIYPDWREIMSNYLQQEVIGKRLGFDKEYKIIRMSDSSVRWVHGRGELLFSKDGELTNLIGNIIDITSRKNNEEEIKLKNELLQTVNSEKDKFFSILAHDLRGPLSAFVAATQIITEEIHTMSVEEIKDITLSMKKSATGIFSLLENLLEWSRLQRGVMDFIPEKINLKKKVNECISVLSESAQKKNIEIEVSISNDIEVIADKNMFDTIIRNLISNALKFTKGGGKVSVSALREKDNSVEIKVFDSGIGMTSELKNKLFRIDEKTSRPGTDGEPSTGLGLLLCKEFVEKHGGKIWVDSEVGRGTTFTFKLP